MVASAITATADIGLTITAPRKHRSTLASVVNTLRNRPLASPGSGSCSRGS